METKSDHYSLEGTFSADLRKRSFMTLSYRTGNFLFGSILGLSLLIGARALGQENSWEIKTFGNEVCKPGELSPENQFSCCVRLAQFIELRDDTTVFLTANPQLCANPKLRGLKFKLSEVAPNGVRVFDLVSPKLDETPFQSSQGRITRFWLNIRSYFRLPTLSYDERDFIPFITSEFGVDEYEMPGLTAKSMTGKSWTALGWKHKSDKTVSETIERSPCPGPFHKTCRYQVETIEETWRNQKTGTDSVRTIERWTNLGID